MKIYQIISLDFDGVVHSYTSGWEGINNIPDLPVPGAIDFIRKHLPVPEAFGGCFEEFKGPIVQIFSSRNKSWRGIRAMKKWLIEHGLEKEYISDNILQFPKDKPPALLTIDDRAMHFIGSFPSTEEIRAFEPWNKIDRLDLKIENYAMHIKKSLFQNKDANINNITDSFAPAEPEQDTIMCDLTGTVTLEQVQKLYFRMLIAKFKIKQDLEQ